MAEAGPFFDTNVPVCAMDRAEPEKREAARSLFREHLREGNGMISPQVLREFYVAVTRKLSTPLSQEGAERAVRSLAAYCSIKESEEMAISAISRTRRFPISFRDALIVEAAVAGGSGRILSEDLQHGRVIDGVRIENTFL